MLDAWPQPLPLFPSALLERREQDIERRVPDGMDHRLFAGSHRPAEKRRQFVLRKV